MFYRLFIPSRHQSFNRHSDCSFIVSSLCVGVQEYLAELQGLLRSVSETSFKLNSPEYWPAAYYNLPQQDHCLKVSTAVT